MLALLLAAEAGDLRHYVFYYFITPYVSNCLMRLNTSVFS